jgi:hypothetical protein
VGQWLSAYDDRAKSFVSPVKGLLRLKKELQGRAIIHDPDSSRLIIFSTETSL